MKLIPLLLTVGFGGWTLLTLVNSFQRGTTVLTNLLGPIHALIPKWNFFSPHPGRYDFSLFYRDKRPNGSTTPWQKVDMQTDQASRLRWLWNPAKYRHKLVFDIAISLKRNVAEVNQERIRDSLADSSDTESDSELVSVDLEDVELSIPYLALLNYVTNQEHDSLSESTQFMIMQHSRATESREPVMISRFHELDT
jgi:hypothetical protein